MSDTKECPFCGETIKAVAIRCRYCHADLTDLTNLAPASDEHRPAARTTLEPWQVTNLLATLVDKNLVVYEEDEHGQARYNLLETIRQYASSRLQEGDESETWRSRHSDFFVALAQEAEPLLTGPEQALWLDRLEAEHDNLRTALTSLLDEGGGDDDSRHARGLRLATAVRWFWDVRGHNTEGRRWLTRALNATPADEAGTRKDRAGALLGAGNLASNQGEFDEAAALYEQSLALFREQQDRQASAILLNNLGNMAMVRGDFATARARFTESLTQSRALGDQANIARASVSLGNVFFHQGDTAAARPLYEESLAINRERGNKQGIAYALGSLATVAIHEGDYGTARALLEQTLALSRELGAKARIGYAAANLSYVHRAMGEHARACALYEESIAVFRQIGERPGLAYALTGLANTRCDQGDTSGAQVLLAQSLELRQAVGGTAGLADALAVSARLAWLAQRAERAVCLFGAIDAISDMTSASLAPNERAEMESMVAAARNTLPEEEFATAWVRGRAMTPEQAIKHALKPDYTAHTA